MIKRICPDKHIVCYYTTRAEAGTPEAGAYLRREFARCRAQSLLPAVLYSGDGDLTELTGALLVGSRGVIPPR